MNAVLYVTAKTGTEEWFLFTGEQTFGLDYDAPPRLGPPPNCCSLETAKGSLFSAVQNVATGHSGPCVAAAAHLFSEVKADIDQLPTNLDL
jgi:hypothetical protein